MTASVKTRRWNSRQKRSVLILAGCQALFQSTFVLVITVGGLVGQRLAGDTLLATLPIAVMVIGTALATVPASLIMGRIGRRKGFVFGAVLGTVGGVLGALAIALGSFILFQLATGLVGVYQGFAQYYRFAAAEVVGDAFRSRAISLVLAGGVLAIAGPQIATWTKDLLPVTYAASFLALTVLSLTAALLLSLIDVPQSVGKREEAAGRPLWAIVSQPVFLVAAGGSAVGNGMMILTMTASPVAMVAHGYEIERAASTIQWHVLAMFVPSFFTGSLVERFSVPAIMLAGIGFLAGHVAVAVWAAMPLHFIGSLLLLGVGWNFLFVGGTTLLTQAYRPAEKAKTQAVNDFLVSGAVAVASFASGGLLDASGWAGVNLSALPFLVLVSIGVVWWIVTQR